MDRVGIENNFDGSSIVNIEEYLMSNDIVNIGGQY